MSCTPFKSEGVTGIVCTRSSPPPLCDITEACLSAKNRGWTREEVKAVLLAHHAAWKGEKITHVPSKSRKKLLSALLHHPSWWRASVPFCAQLQVLGFPYTIVKAACLELGWSPPSMIGPDSRKILVGMLADPESRVRQAIEDLRRKDNA